MRPGLRIASAWLPAVLYMLAIWWLSSQRVDLPLESIPMRDKGLHFIEFGLLGGCFAHAVWITWPGRGVRGALAAAFFTAAFGLLDELHQAFVPGRSADVADLLADALGGTLAVVVFWSLRGRLAQRRGEAPSLVTPP
jgi:VanZ family protein